MLFYGFYSYETNEKIIIYSYDFWFISMSGFWGFVLLFTGDKFINTFINLIIDYIKKFTGNNG